jgi:catechol 2,3-dioxygenase-like lactoylglutathione lyase family enzyme
MDAHWVKRGERGKRITAVAKKAARSHDSGNWPRTCPQSRDCRERLRSADTRQPAIGAEKCCVRRIGWNKRAQDTLAWRRPEPNRSRSNRKEQRMASVRYIAVDVDISVAFYRDRLDFAVDMHNSGKFAALKRGDLTLYLSAPGAGSGGTAGGTPEPGGWNRFMLVTDDVDGLIERLEESGVTFRGEISEAGAGRARLLEDPSGNLIELFEFKRK